MKPPMNDSVIVRKPTGIKDGRGFPTYEDHKTFARVTEETTLVKDSDGIERQSAYTIILPASIHPQLNDDIKVTDSNGNETSVTVIKRKSRKSYSGRVIYYWVVHCG